MNVLHIAVLTVVAACAGAVNAVAGGGTLLTFPALMAVGYGAKVANVTNTVAIWPGTIGGSIAYRSELGQRRRRLLVLIVPAVAGAILGAVLLLSTSQQVFSRIVPFLIYFACALLAFQGPLGRLATRRGMGATDNRHVPITLHIAIFLVGIYGAYFGAGIGILMLAILGILAADTLHHSNALKGMLALIINFVALVAFVFFSHAVQWGPAVFMAVGAIVGGYGGVRLARRLDARLLRALIVVYGAGVATLLLVH